jgi:preprotein translocase subunit SecD
MFKSLKGRIAVIVGVIALCAWALVPKEGPQGRTISPLNLGLDLQGGMHLAIEIADSTITGQDRADALERVLTTIRNRINEFGVREPIIQQVGDDRVIVELAGIDDPERAKEIVARTAFLEFKLVRDGERFRQLLPRLDRTIVRLVEGDTAARGALATAEGEAAGDAAGGEGELDQIFGDQEGQDTAGAAAETDSGQEGGIPGLGDEGQDRPLTSLLLESGTHGGIFLVAEQDFPTVDRYLEMDSVQALLPRNTELRWSANAVGQGGQSYRRLYVLEGEPMITGEYLDDAGPATRDPTYNMPIVPFEFTRRGGRIFQRVTSQNVNEYMAIVLDGRVQSAPEIRSTIGQRGQIEMGQGSSLQEAQDLALVLRAGALPVPIEIVEERTVGPSLGADSISQGQIAFIIGLALVVLMIIAYYKVSGLLAVGALTVYVIIMLGGLAGLGATLTLPGIAGIILSIGMAVDANVLIFERIREELDVGKTSRTAVEEGFDHALSAIVDANLTTLITAIILYQVGTGPVKGFAVTLSIGIVASFFSALYVTKTFYRIYLDRRSPAEPVSI